MNLGLYNVDIVDIQYDVITEEIDQQSKKNWMGASRLCYIAVGGPTIHD